MSLKEFTEDALYALPAGTFISAPALESAEEINELTAGIHADILVAHHVRDWKNIKRTRRGFYGVPKGSISGKPCALPRPSRDLGDAMRALGDLMKEEYFEVSIQLLSNGKVRVALREVSVVCKEDLALVLTKAMLRVVRMSPVH